MQASDATFSVFLEHALRADGLPQPSTPPRPSPDTHCVAHSPSPRIYLADTPNAPTKHATHLADTPDAPTKHGIYLADTPEAPAKHDDADEENGNESSDSYEYAEEQPITLDPKRAHNGYGIHDILALKAEKKAAAAHGLSWQERGPPGPEQGGPSVWRGQPYRPGSKKFAKRGGRKEKERLKRKAQAEEECVWNEYYREKKKEFRGKHADNPGGASRSSRG